MDDDKNMDILTAYQIYLVKQMDILFSTIAMFGLTMSNDLRMRANIKDMETKYKFNYQQFLTSLEKIVSPETAGDMDGAAKAAKEETAKADGKVKKTLETEVDNEKTEKK